MTTNQRKAIDELIKDLRALSNYPNNIHKWNSLNVFFKQFINIMSDEQGTVFKNFYTKYRDVIHRLDLDEVIIKNFDSMRRCLNREELPNAESVEQAFLFISYVFDTLQGYQNINIANLNINYFTQKLPARTLTNNLKVLCDKWSEIQVDAGGNKYFYILGYEKDGLLQGGEIRIKVTDSKFTQLTNLSDTLTRGCWLNIEKVKKEEESLKNLYYTTFESIITLYPDFLIDASGIGECFLHGKVKSSETFIFSKLINDLSSEAALKGSIIGFYLDEMIRDEKNAEEIFLKAQRIYALQAAALGSQVMKNIKESIHSEHYKNLSFLRDSEHTVPNKLWLEPSYISNIYGIQGRIDLLVTDDSSKNKGIIELKSGTPANPTFSIAWDNHEYQVVAYDMLLESTYKENVKGSRSVFYSKCNIAPYRKIVSEAKERQNAIAVRNKIVNDIYDIASNKFDVLEKISKGAVTLPKFKAVSHKDFSEIYSESRINKHYYNELIAFTLRELICAKVGGTVNENRLEAENGFASLWLDNLKTKRDNFGILDDLNIENVD